MSHLRLGRHLMRSYSSAPPPMSKPLRIGFVPEHFSTPLHYASTRFALAATLVPFPSGTGHMITSLRADEIDVGIGLTEGWVAGLGKPAAQAGGGGGGAGGYQIVGTYVDTPLCWAISTGRDRALEDVDALKGGKMGVSRIGSGSYVMGFVLADTKGWLTTAGDAPFDVVPLQTFARLRDGVNDRTADFFMWEHFTSKRYYDNGAIKRIGEIYTPWSSWKIVARDAGDERLGAMFESINRGVAYFEGHPDESVRYISTHLDYSEADAREWLKTVGFPKDVRGVSHDTIARTIETLRKAGVIEGNEATASNMIGISKQ
ncbi:hypothetical protein MMC15_007134 [Xylographa vitiligo]|nr:hypothetical protein [Xylographa vitiligo]